MKLEKGLRTCVELEVMQMQLGPKWTREGEEERE